MADQLCTTAQVKTRLSIADATDDALISELIDQASDLISDYTGRKLVAEPAVTYTVDTARGSRIDLPRGIRVVSALAVAGSDQPDTGGTYTAVLAADILVRPSPVNRRPGWPGTYLLIKGAAPRLVDALNGATVTGDWGFSPTPPAIVAVAIDTVIQAYKLRKSRATGQVGADDVDAGMVLADAPARLARYRGGAGIS
jgi:hypothetical protein